MSSENSKVAIVDDDPAMLRLLSVWLEKAGYQVETFEDARKALASIEENPPDFLITDWEMPYMTGIELCHRVRELKLTHYIYTIFLTVRSAPKEMIAGLEIGADDFLSKPIHQGELLARVRAGARIIELERRLGLMARTDYLTGLTTQRVFYESLDKEWSRAERTGAPLSCVMMDIDFFKKVNDVHGHPAGDAVLRKVADVLRKNSRASDVPCRYGGEEFCILLPETREENATLWTERIRKQLAESVVSSGEKNIQITASFGVAQRRDDTQQAESLVDQADQALLYAKQSGRNRVIAFDSLSDSLTVDSDLFGEHGMFAEVHAEQIMSPIIASLREDDTIGEAADYFLRLRINSACVLNTQGNLAGILSEKDLLAAMVSLDQWDLPIRDVMKPNVICYDADTPIQAIYQFLCRVSIRRVVILRDDRPVGTISRGTLLRWLRNLIIAQRGFPENAHREPGATVGTHQSHQRLIDTAKALAQRINELCEQCQEPSDAIDPSIVGKATQIQDLLRDVLAHTGYRSGTATISGHGG